MRVKMKTAKPSNSMIAFVGVIGLIFAFNLRFPFVEIPPYLKNLSGFFQISSRVLLSYLGCQKRQIYWKRNRNNPKVKRRFLWFASCIFAVAFVLLLKLYICPKAIWFLETLLSTILGIFVSINDIVDPWPKNKKKAAKK